MEKHSKKHLSLAKRAVGLKLPPAKKLFIDTKVVPSPASATAPKTTKNVPGNLANYRFKQYQKQASNLKNGSTVPTPKGNMAKVSLQKNKRRAAALAASLETSILENLTKNDKSVTRNTIRQNGSIKGNNKIYMINNTLDSLPNSININIANQVHQVHQTAGNHPEINSSST